MSNINNKHYFEEDGDVELLDLNILESDSLLENTDAILLENTNSSDSLWEDVIEVYNKFRYGYGIHLTFLLAGLISYFLIIGQYQLKHMMTKPVAHTWETLVFLLRYLLNYLKMHNYRNIFDLCLPLIRRIMYILILCLVVLNDIVDLKTFVNCIFLYRDHI